MRSRGEPLFSRVSKTASAEKRFERCGGGVNLRYSDGALRQ
jgi:hypothetical protein